MSHFTEIKTKIERKELLEEALKALNMEFRHDEVGVEVRGFFGDKVTCDFSISTGTTYDVGLRKTEEGSYEFVGDWDMLKAHKVDAESLRNKILQRYNLLSVKETLTEQGYELGEEQVDQEGNIQYVVSRW